MPRPPLLAQDATGGEAMSDEVRLSESRPMLAKKCIVCDDVHA
jgi:hypothetical protein